MLFEGHNAFVTWSYIITALVVGGAIAHTIWQGRVSRKKLAELETAHQETSEDTV